ncbi:hypothetical protein C0993_007187 [Termitomyces sp. T159_Od127]|nr:hypothetical protein C0993_007187 [Termitomyces sp. T159_Od127]
MPHSLGLVPTPSTHPPPSPALAPLAGATGAPPHTTPALLRSPMPRALLVLCICVHGDHHIRYLPSGLSPHSQRNLTDNDLEGCWYPMGAPPCFKCAAMKRPCTLDGAKTQECGNTPDPTVEKTYHCAVLMRRAQAVVEKVREAEAQEEAIGFSKKSLVLLMCQGDEKRGSGKGKRKASPPLLPTDKGKKRARVVSPAAVTPKVESEGDEEDKARCLGMAIEASKAALGMEDLVGPSCQAEVPQDVGALHEDEEEAMVGLEAAPQVQPWRWGLPQ